MELTPFDYVLYFSGGKKSQIVAEFFDLPTIPIPQVLPNFNRIIIVCPTYGDEELPLEIEDFLIELNINDKEYALCVLGNYFGYEREEFGPAKIIRYELAEKNWKLLSSPLSLDSVPQIDWECLKCWKDKLFNQFKN